MAGPMSESDPQEYWRQLDALQAKLGRFFKDRSLLAQALTHPSAVAEEGRPRLLSYERLEFLGDALVNAYLARLLFDFYPGQDEGGLTRLRAFWISQPSLAATARELGIGACLRLGVGEERSGGQDKERVLASALEALFAALYLDAGYPAGFRLARKLWAGPIRKRGLEVLQEDAKTALQETRQAGGLAHLRVELHRGTDGLGLDYPHLGAFQGRCIDRVEACIKHRHLVESGTFLQHPDDKLPALWRGLE